MESPTAEAAIPFIDKDPLAGLEPLPIPEPKLPVDHDGLSTGPLAKPAAHPSEPVLPQASPADPSFGEPAFPEPPLPAPEIGARGPLGGMREPVEPTLRHGLDDPIERDPIEPGPAERDTIEGSSIERGSVEGDLIESIPKFGSARDLEMQFGPVRGIEEPFGSARELSAARRFGTVPTSQTPPPDRVEPTLDADRVTVTGSPNFPEGDDDPAYGAVPLLTGERAVSVDLSEEPRRPATSPRGSTAWRRIGLATVAIALVLAGGAAAIALIRLTAADVPASELSIAEIVDRAAARLREFGVLP